MRINFTFSPNNKYLQDSPWRGLSKPKAEFVGCSCISGLFRDRNATLRKPIRFMTGVSDIATRGQIVEYNNSPKLNFWKKGSTCDEVKGALDSSTYPTNITRDMDLSIFISLICRKSQLVYEKVNKTYCNIFLASYHYFNFRMWYKMESKESDLLPERISSAVTATPTQSTTTLTTPATAWRRRAPTSSASNPA